MTNSPIPLWVGLVVAAAGMIVLTIPAWPKAAPQEFVCYDDGQLTERHALVRKADLTAPGVWRITYTDGQRAVYAQPAGETCQVENPR